MRKSIASKASDLFNRYFGRSRSWTGPAFIARMLPKRQRFRRPHLIRSTRRTGYAMLAGAVIVKVWQSRETLIPIAVKTGRRLQPVIGSIRDNESVKGAMHRLPGRPATEDGAGRKGGMARPSAKAGTGS